MDNSLGLSTTKVFVLNEEIFTDILKGDKRRVDLLVETKLKGEDGLIVVHVEAQAYEQKNFNERMFIYFSRLYEKYRKKILPIAVFSYDTIREEPHTFNLGFSFFDVLTFQFHKVELKKKHWRDYIKQDNPVAAALLSKMGYSESEKIQVKKEFLRMLVRLELDPARAHLIAGFFDTYLILGAEEEEQLQQELKSLDQSEEAKIMELKTAWEKQAEERAEKRAEQRMMKLKTTWEKQAEERMMKLKTAWEKQAEERAEKNAKQSMLCKYLEAQFGAASAELTAKVKQLTDNQVIEKLSERLFTISQVDEAEQIIQDAVEEESKKS